MRILKNNLFSNNDIIKSNNKFQKKLKLTYITYVVKRKLCVENFLLVTNTFLVNRFE